MASTGNTQGMRLRIRPPSRAPNKAAPSVSELALLTGAAARAALASSAACKASGTAAGSGATAGQTPCTGTARRAPAEPGPWPGGLASATTSASCVGLSLRCGESGTRAVQRSPSHAWVQGEPGSIRPVVSG